MTEICYTQNAERAHFSFETDSRSKLTRKLSTKTNNAFLNVANRHENIDKIGDNSRASLKSYFDRGLEHSGSSMEAEKQRVYRNSPLCIDSTR